MRQLYSKHSWLIVQTKPLILTIVSVGLHGLRLTSHHLTMLNQESFTESLHIFYRLSGSGV